jgi:Fic family protein
LADAEAIARLLLRAEAVASSKIEGLQIGGRRLLRAQLARDTDGGADDVGALEILNNVDAMRWAVSTLTARDRIAVDDLLQIHDRLLAGTTLESHGGRMREEQNWIGGSDFNPCRAAFVPPPPEHVPMLLEDLCAFLAEDSVPALVQAAIAHAQFETIHPFIDGNGRTGRALVHVVLRRRLDRHPLPR